MWEDPIVAEVHRTREMLERKFNFDIDAIFANRQARQAALGDRLLSPRKRAEPTAGTAPGHLSGCPGPTSFEPAPAAKRLRWGPCTLSWAEDLPQFGWCL